MLCPTSSDTNVVGSDEISATLHRGCRCGPECGVVGNVLVMEMDINIEYLQ